jgi:autotransporter-associated beta strand protein
MGAAMGIRTRGTATLLLTCCTALHWSPAHSVTYTWIGGAISNPNDWATPSNWNPNGVPGVSATDTATFPVGAMTTSVSVDAITSETLASITTQDFYTFAFFGQITLSSGIISAPSSPLISIGPSGVFNLVGNASIASSIITNSGLLHFSNSSSAASSNIANSSGGQLLFDNNSTAAQATITNSGTVVFSNFPDANSASIQQNGGTLDFSGVLGSIAVGALSGSAVNPGSVLLGGASVVIGSLNTNDTLRDVISGNGGSLIKVGSGVMSLTGNNTYTGPTTVQNGILDIAGSISGSVTVSAGATLTGGPFGNGVAGDVTNYGTVQPNGIFVIHGSQYSNPNSVIHVSVDSAGNSSRLSVMGSAYLNGCLHIGFPGGSPPLGTTSVLLNASAIFGSFAAFSTDRPGFGTLAYSSTQVTFTTPPAEYIFGDGFEAPACD